MLTIDLLHAVADQKGLPVVYNAYALLIDWFLKLCVLDRGLTEAQLVRDPARSAPDHLETSISEYTIIRFTSAELNFIRVLKLCFMYLSFSSEIVVLIMKLPAFYSYTLTLPLVISCKRVSLLSSSSVFIRRHCWISLFRRCRLIFSSSRSDHSSGWSHF